jgi:uncharacterized protein
LKILGQRMRGILFGLREKTEMGAVFQLLPDGKRLHLNHGPIDLIIKADGPPQQIRRAYRAAEERFATVLEELVSELPLLRSEISARGLKLQGAISRNMERVTRPHWNCRVTPMAAVAGAVADEILAVMLRQADLSRAYVNNGGDIALHLNSGASFMIASAAGPITVRSEDKIGGIATSGWRGRSFSLGIADSVTVLAKSAAEADVAATLIANAVDLVGSKKINRQPACELAPDSDLLERLVTVEVLPLEAQEVDAALASGVKVARNFLRRDLIFAAALMLDDKIQHVRAAARDAVAAPSKEIHYV